MKSLLRAESIRGRIGDLYERDFDAVLRQLLPDTVNIVDAGIGSEPHPVPYALAGDIGRLDVRLHAHQRQLRLEVVRVGGVRERTHLEKIAILGRAGLGRRLLGRFAHLALGDLLLLAWKDPVEIESRLV